ncbi:Na/Pi symporter [Kiritimatiellota bacterium B12222]|nr:Na/Pi symporter [Kiritimatiellota bacterium B12222]
MFSKEIFLVIFTLLGGLVLFLLGMNMMSAGLTSMAGKGMRGVIHHATKNRMKGIVLGSGLGFLVQSSAGTVMLVGFVNAGLMSLQQSIPVIFGVNIGTTLSMQLISFKISEYCFLAMTIGFLCSQFISNPRGKAAGKSLLGFGLLFLGMSTMSEGVAPYRDSLAPFLSMVDGSSGLGALRGVAIAAGITAIIQSSGATIGMVFALISAGAITQITGAYPLIIGAGIGTCMTALLGSLGANIQARRTAVSHLCFNIISTLLALILAPWIYKWVSYFPGDLVHQAANANMIRMMISGVILLPFVGIFTRAIVWMTPSNQPIKEGSFLDDRFITRPEKAITACIAELRRAAVICEESLLLHAQLFRSIDRKTVTQICRNEEIINEIKLAMEDYVLLLTQNQLSKRQALMIQHLNRCMSHLERIGDHVERLSEITLERLSGRPVLFEEDLLAKWFGLYGSALKVVRMTIDSLDPHQKKFQKTAAGILESRDHYMSHSFEFRSHYNDCLAGKEGTLSPKAGIYLTKYVDGLDRIVKHSKSIALLQAHPEFWIKRKKLERVAQQAPPYLEPKMANVQDYLDALQSEDR